MSRIVTALVVAGALALPAAAGAKTVELTPKAKWSLKKKRKKSKHKVYFRLSFSKKDWKKIRKARGKVKVNFYAGKSRDDTRPLHKMKKKFWGKKAWRKFGRKFRTKRWRRVRRRRTRFTFKKKYLCKKGLTHLRAKVKIKSRREGVKFENITKRFEIDCD